MPGALTQHDIDLAGSFIFTFSNTQAGADEPLEFQFPPKISSDGRRGRWEEQERRGREPLATFSTSGPREITLTATYIVGGTPGWDVKRIHKQLLLARGYFARMRDLKNNTRNLICKINMWGIGGADTMTCRLTNIGVKYSDTIVGVGGEAHFLRTDLTLDIRLWTKGGDAEAGEKVVDVPGLRDFESKDWY